MDRYYQLSDGKKIRYKIHHSKSKKVTNRWLICLHGLGEHLGRHQYLLKTFKHEYNIFQFDLRGHGKSDGERSSICHFDRFILDLKEILDFLIHEHSVSNFDIFAHSMGALITCGHLKKNQSKKELMPQKVFLSAPPVGFANFKNLLPLIPTKITHLLAKIPISLPIPSPKDYQRYSHSKNIINKLKKDPLVNQKTQTKLLFSVINAAQVIFSSPINTDCQIFLCVGSHDRIICHESAVKYFSKTMPIEKILIIPGGFHELHNEIERYNRPFLDFLVSCLSYKSQNIHTTKKSA